VDPSTVALAVGAALVALTAASLAGAYYAGEQAEERAAEAREALLRLELENLRGQYEDLVAAQKASSGASRALEREAAHRDLARAVSDPHARRRLLLGGAPGASGAARGDPPGSAAEGPPA